MGNKEMLNKEMLNKALDYVQKLYFEEAIPLSVCTLEANKILGKAWRNQDLTMEEIKILAENKLETVNKIEIKMYENKLVYVVFFENDASRYAGGLK